MAQVTNLKIAEKSVSWVKYYPNQGIQILIISNKGIETFFLQLDHSTGVIRFQISKLVLHTSGRVLSGSVTVVLGGVTMLYDIYKVTHQVVPLVPLTSKLKLRFTKT